MPWELDDASGTRYSLPASMSPAQRHIGGQPRTRFVRGYGSERWFTVQDGIRDPEPFALVGVLQTDRNDSHVQTLLNALDAAVAGAVRLYHVDHDGNDLEFLEILGGLPLEVSPDGVDASLLTVTARLVPATGAWASAAGSSVDSGSGPGPGPEPEPEPDYEDDFESHSVATGIPTGWSDGGGTATPTWSVTATSPLAGAKSLRAASVTGTRNLVFAGSTLTNGLITALVQPASASFGNNVQPGVIARYANASNLVRVRASRNDPERGLILSQRIANTETVLDFAVFAIALGATYKLELELSGATATARLRDTNGILLATATASVSVAAGGPVGVSASGDGAVMMFDDFQAFVD